MKLDRDVLILGGPRHGEWLALSDGPGMTINMPKYTPLDPTYWLGDKLTPWTDSFQVVNYRVEHTSLGPTTKIRYARHPDMSPRTAGEIIGDLLTVAVESYKGDLLGRSR